MVKELWIDFFFLLVEGINGPWVVKKMFNVILQEVQIKTTRRYHITLLRRVIITESKSNRCWQGCWGKGPPPSPLQWKCNIVQPLWKSVQWFLRKLKTELSSHPATPHLVIYLRKQSQCVGIIALSHSLRHCLQRSECAYQQKRT